MHSRTGTASVPSRVIAAPRFGVASPGEDDGRHQDLPDDEDDSDGEQVGLGRPPGTGGCRPPGCRPPRRWVRAAAVNERPTARCVTFSCRLDPALRAVVECHPTMPLTPMASGTRPRSPTTAGENSKSTIVPAAATRDRSVKPITWPTGIRRARSAGAPATMAMVTTQLSMFVPTNAAAAMPMSAGKPAAATESSPSARGHRHGRAEGLVAPQGHPVRVACGCPVVV